MTMKIVVWDPSGAMPEGSIVTDLPALSLAAAGVVMLPVVPRLFESSGVGGYAKRAWGPGVELSQHMPRLSCPLTMYAAKELRGLHWVARLAPISVAPFPEVHGQIRLTADGNQPGVLNASFQGGAHVDLKALGPIDARGGWTVGGHGIITPSGDGYTGFALYGVGSGLRVLWAAISQAEV